MFFLISRNNQLSNHALFLWTNSLFNLFLLKFEVFQSRQLKYLFVSSSSSFRIKKIRRLNLMRVKLMYNTLVFYLKCSKSDRKGSSQMDKCRNKYMLKSISGKLRPSEAKWTLVQWARPKTGLDLISRSSSVLSVNIKEIFNQKDSTCILKYSFIYYWLWSIEN